MVDHGRAKALRVVVLIPRISTRVNILPLTHQAPKSRKSHFCFDENRDDISNIRRSYSFRTYYSAYTDFLHWEEGVCMRKW